MKFALMGFFRGHAYVRLDSEGGFPVQVQNIIVTMELHRNERATKV
jgi:hypothetical protein